MKFLTIAFTALVLSGCNLAVNGIGNDHPSSHIRSTHWTDNGEIIIDNGLIDGEYTYITCDRYFSFAHIRSYDVNGYKSPSGVIDVERYSSHNSIQVRVPRDNDHCKVKYSSRDLADIFGYLVNMLARYATAGPSILIETATQNNTSLGSVVSILTTKIVDSLTLKDYVDEDFIKLSADLTALAGATNLLLLPHSQGTLYAGRVYQQYIKTGRKVSIAAVANAALSLPAGEYVTSHNDGVISWLNTLYKTAPSNTTIERNPLGSMGHTLEYDYLGMSAGQSAIASMIDRQLANVPTITIGGDNGVPVTLSWSTGEPLTLWVSGLMTDYSPVVGVNGTATYNICKPSNFTFYFVWVSTAGGWPANVTVSANGQSKTYPIATYFSQYILGNIAVKPAGSIYIDLKGFVNVS